MRLLKSLFIFLGLLISLLVMATHNRAGEITFKQINDFTYEITVITYTSSLPGAADRPFLYVDFGDELAQDVARVEKVPLPNDYYWNKYVVEHTFPGIGTYEIVVEDPNRNYGVNNIPNSVYVVFTIQTILKIDPVLGYNNTPVLLNPPIDRAARSHLFVHNPVAYDPDGDSITFKLTECLGNEGEPIPGYEFPVASDTFFMEAVSGNLIWNTPMETGSFNVAINIEEWREGYKIGNIVRDMQIDVFDTENQPPINHPIEECCIQAGDTLSFEIESSDANSDSIQLTLLGGPVVFDDYPAEELEILESVPGYTKTRFFWPTHWSHIRHRPYNFVVKAIDINEDISLVDIDNFSVKIIGAAPKKLQAFPNTNSVNLQWYSSEHENIKSYRVYRKVDSSDYEFDKCQQGLEDSLGFVYLGNTNSANDTVFLDNNNEEGLDQGNLYCYRVVAEYTDGALSYPSNEVCVELEKGTPLIINTSVLETSETEGKVFLRWLVPRFGINDFPGPYRYIISRAIGEDDFQVIDSTLTELNDSVYIDSLVNTIDSRVYYRIETFNLTPRIQIGHTSYSSTVFMTTQSSHATLELNFLKNVPWFIDQYNIYRKSNSEFELIDSTENNYYRDTGLINDQEYFYKLEAKGYLSTDKQNVTNINWSSVVSGIPYDNQAPEKPHISLQVNCEDYSNLLSWEYEGGIQSEDISQFYIYYSNLIGASFTKIDSVSVNSNWNYLHIPELNPGGHYGISAVDYNFNESSIANIIAPDTCGLYVLPNVFTPNNDYVNDILKPVKAELSYIERIDFKLYNRIGVKVFETTDPAINWDGKINDRTVSPGVYFYVCDIYERRSIGVLHGTPLSGFIYILTGDKEGRE